MISQIIMIVGIVIMIVGGIFFIIETFRESILWGIGCIIISPIAIIFAFLHWDVSKSPILIQLAGLAVTLLGGSLGGGF